ncbi:exopolyphosphatase/guanosine-5'-triphosphate,3'-diphosphate pyrophosphatase [Zymomonas mobilis]|uniref:Ppx/GppA phosphatase family protein n=1 Tax=Zymomonas mobilis TaxID=542 RepID=UPI00026D8803|nr:Ppx/GppA phosphatase family protein [Zymomonas mobilis]AFN56744.1 Ppx/GppA phosphatase [Zymomonas mobilis subsp. mobilis ATCC 29191]TQK77825.1 exopolyphosphatase/guanosine-5'-triphosphate,3'-diphosphate pyrophosphatase [Zymomonas mobilis]TQL15529.1 exopolyphosphatase/guanosine-5'-triphosphate,3'-diphosphate pyrophosphatase [Zymomonas mobilis]GEB87097.1 phosphatase [Zymomonas mobilis subsp. mobilis]
MAPPLFRAVPTFRQRSGGRYLTDSSLVASPQNTFNLTRPRVYGALDLGTNNCRLLIARAEKHDFMVVDAFSRIVRLGEGLAASHRLSDAAIDRALAALSVCAEKLRKRNVFLARSVATEACRRALNGRNFVQRVYKETGLLLEIISAEQEAQLAVLGCHMLLTEKDVPSLIFDIGGGSTELILTMSDHNGPKVLDWVSVPWGVVSLTESLGYRGNSLADRKQAYQAMKDQVKKLFLSFSDRLKKQRLTPRSLLGTSGTVATLGSIYLELPRYDRRMVDGLIAPTAALRQISKQLSLMSIKERAKITCIGEDRADLIVAGCAILDAIVEIWPINAVHIADRGIREGILRDLIARYGYCSRPFNRERFL